MSSRECSLVLSTSFPSQVIGLFREDELLAEEIHEEEKDHVQTLVQRISTLLEKKNVQQKDLSRIIADRGPGSFTGVRISLVTGQILSEFLSIPLVLITSLEALAFSAPEGVYTVPVLDARRGRVYAAVFGPERKRLSEWLDCKPEELSEVIKKTIPEKESIFFSGNGFVLYLDMIKNRLSGRDFKNSEKAFPGALDLYQAARINGTDGIGGEPLYVRKSDAEEMKS